MNERNRKMKKLTVISALVLALVCGVSLTGCQQADRVSSNLSKEADNFNVVRKLTVINSFSDTVIFQMTGYISIKVDTEDNQLEITVKESDDSYKKHFVNLNEFTVYLVEDVTGSDVSASKYSLSWNPDMVLPFDVKDRR